MSTEIQNDAGDTVALAYHGGTARGPMSDVAMPESVARMVAAMPVFASGTPDLRTTLGQWIEDQREAGRTVRFHRDIQLNLR